MKNANRLDMIMHLGWTVILALLLPLGLGLWVDSQFSTSPLFILIGAMLGIIVATVGVVRITAGSIAKLSEPKRTPTGKLDREEDEE